MGERAVLIVEDRALECTRILHPKAIVIPVEVEARIIATARAEALREARSVIKNDLNTFTVCGRKDIKGHLRAIMLINELLADKQEAVK